MSQPKVKKLSDLSIGDKIKFGENYVYDKYEKSVGTQKLVWTVIAKNHHLNDPNYPAKAITILSDKIMGFKVFDAKEPFNSDSKRQRYGNNRYMTSNIRQWLNSSAAENEWYVEQNTTSPNGAHYNDRDTPPIAENILTERKPYKGTRGFLHDFKVHEREALMPTTLTMGLNTVTDGSVGQYDTVTDRLFLLSKTEVGFGDNFYSGGTDGVSVREGAPIPYFVSDQMRMSTATILAFQQSAYNNGYNSKDSYYPWVLRSAMLNTTHRNLFVNTIGWVAKYASSTPDDIETAYCEHGIKPAANLNPDTLVSYDPDVDGHYILIPNYPPYVEILKNDMLDISYKVTDLKDSISEVKIYVNSGLKETLVDGFNNELNYKIPFKSLSLGTNELKFTTKDTLGLEGTQIFNVELESIDLPTVYDRIVANGRRYSITSKENKPDGTVDLIIDSNLNKTLPKNDFVERLLGYSIPSCSIKHDMSAPSFVEMNHVRTMYNDDHTTAIEEFELEGNGSYAQTKLTVKRDNGEITPRVKRVSQIFRYEEEL